MHDTVPHELIRHRANHRRGNGEAETDVSAGGRQNLCVDANQLSAEVHERATRVALVDGRVGLNEVLAMAIPDSSRAALRADNAHGDGLPDAQWVPEGQHHVAHADLIGVSERNRGQTARLDLEDGEVARGVPPHDFRIEETLVGKLDAHPSGIRDDVLVGEHVTIIADHHPRTEPALPVRSRGLRCIRDLPAEEIAERFRKACGRRRDLLLDPDRDNRRRNPVDDPAVGGLNPRHRNCRRAFRKGLLCRLGGDRWDRSTADGSGRQS